METKTLKIEKILSCSTAEVFNAFATAEALKKWWGPVESPIEVLKLEFRPQGVFHYKMNGEHIYYGIFKYLEIKEPEYIVWINSFANSEGEIVKAPFEGIDFALEVLNRVSFSEISGKTLLTMTSQPVNATESEINCFNSIFENMLQATDAMLGELEKYLK